MDAPRTLASALALTRVVFGLGNVIVPAQSRAAWIGRAGKKPGAKVMIRSQGVRDIVLGGGALQAISRGDARELRTWMVGHGICDVTDMVVTLAARDDLPKRRARFAIGVAAVSTLIAAGSVAGLRDAPDGSAASAEG